MRSSIILQICISVAFVHECLSLTKVLHKVSIKKKISVSTLDVRKEIFEAYPVRATQKMRSDAVVAYEKLKDWKIHQIHPEVWRQTDKPSLTEKLFAECGWWGPLLYQQVLGKFHLFLDVPDVASAKRSCLEALDHICFVRQQKNLPLSRPRFSIYSGKKIMNLNQLKYCKADIMMLMAPYNVGVPNIVAVSGLVTGTEEQLKGWSAFFNENPHLDTFKGYFVGGVPRDYGMQFHHLIEKLPRALHKLKLYCPENAVEQEMIEAFKVLSHQDSQLKALTLHRCNFSDDALKMFSAWFTSPKAKGQIKKLALHQLTFSGDANLNTMLKIIDSGTRNVQTDLGRHVPVDFGEIEGDSEIKSDPEDNGTADEYVETVSDSSGVSTGSASSSGLERLALTGLEISKDHTELLQGIIKNLVQLTELDLSNNNIDTGTIRALEPILKTRESLESLILRDNQINSETLGELLTTQRSQIKMIDLTNNLMSEQAMVNIFKAAFQSGTLEHLKLQGNQLTVADSNAILIFLKGLEKKQSLARVTFPATGYIPKNLFLKWRILSFFTKKQ